jgi:hypothetical protein
MAMERRRRQAIWRRAASHPAGGKGPITLVQFKLGQNSGASNVQIVMDAPTTPGNLLVAFCGFRSTAGTIPAAFTQFGATVDCAGAGDNGPIVAAYKTAVAQTNVGTWSHTSSVRVVVMEFANAQLTPATPQSLSNQGSSTHPLLSAVPGVAGARNLVVAGFCQPQGLSNGFTGFTPDSPFIELDDGQVEAPNGGPRTCVDYRIDSTGSALYSAGVVGGNLPWGAVAATFLQA